MADGKWIPNLRSEMGLSEAAVQVLRLRLDVVTRQLPLVLQQAHEDPEHVHQLRVATRRADAALRIFRCCLPGRVYREVRARLRTYRRAAGAARDWDVFLLALGQRSTEVPEGEKTGIDFLIGYALGHREAAAVGLAALEDKPTDSFAAFVEETLDEVRDPDGDERLGDLARRTLTTLLARLERTASGNLRDYDQLHQVRIAGKRLRYAIEVLSDCFPPAMRETLYPRVEEMQELLGRANDSHVATGRLLGLSDALADWPTTRERVAPGLEALLRYHQRRLPAERRRFVKWWEAWRKLQPETLLHEPPAG